jgi:hypothetical protein
MNSLAWTRGTAIAARLGSLRDAIEREAAAAKMPGYVLTWPIVSAANIANALLAKERAELASMVEAAQEAGTDASVAREKQERAAAVVAAKESFVNLLRDDDVTVTYGQRGKPLVDIVEGADAGLAIVLARTLAAYISLLRERVLKVSMPAEGATAALNSLTFAELQPLLYRYMYAFYIGQQAGVSENDTLVHQLQDAATCVLSRKLNKLEPRIKVVGGAARVVDKDVMDKLAPAGTPDVLRELMRPEEARPFVQCPATLEALAEALDKIAAAEGAFVVQVDDTNAPVPRDADSVRMDPPTAIFCMYVWKIPTLKACAVALVDMRARLYARGAGMPVPTSKGVTAGVSMPYRLPTMAELLAPSPPLVSTAATTGQSRATAATPAPAPSPTPNPGSTTGKEADDLEAMMASTGGIPGPAVNTGAPAPKPKRRLQAVVLAGSAPAVNEAAPTDTGVPPVPKTASIRPGLMTVCYFDPASVDSRKFAARVVQGVVAELAIPQDSAEFSFYRLSSASSQTIEEAKRRLPVTLDTSIDTVLKTDVTDKLGPVMQ